jgi:hypothetical protein
VQLHFSNAKATSKARTGVLTKENVELFISELNKHQNEGGFKILPDGSNLFNADETLLTVSSKNEGKLFHVMDAIRST